jgi:hypothetical protein
MTLRNHEYRNHFIAACAFVTYFYPPALITKYLRQLIYSKSEKNLCIR